MALEKELQYLGLSDKEARVYLAALELGSATAQEVSKKAGINRATAYFVLKQLMGLGLVSEIEEDKVAKYAAENPSQLQVLIKKKEEEVRASERTFNDILPELRSIHNRSEGKPIVRYHDGREGPELIRSEMLKLKNDEVFVFYDYDKIKEIFTEEETAQFAKDKKKRGLKTKAIYTSQSDLERPAIGTTTERRKIDVKEFPINGDISIYGDIVKVSKFLKGKNVGVVTIEDKDIAGTFKTLFKLAWKGAE